MTRLPPRPDITFREDGTPVAAGHDDVYFSAEDGLQETRAVFLKGCGLPGAWAGREHFTIAELGFGTGLNFLALWQLWSQTRPSPTARLHVVSFEGYPMTAEQALTALSRWPELSHFTMRLFQRWPVRARGIQVLDFPDHGVTLTLHMDDIARALPASVFTADAWFLDGFSPAKNADMWDSELFDHIAERSAPGARAATFTVAGHVRRALTDAGFEAEKKQGHGRKRERLEARFTGSPARTHDPYGLRSKRPHPKRIAILGGGIAGAHLADACHARGIQSVLFDPAPTLAAGASGNPLALVHPRLDAGDTPAARIHLQAYLHARRVLTDLPEAALPLPVLQAAKDETEAARYEKLHADPPLDTDLLAFDEAALIHQEGFAVQPAALIRALTENTELRLGQPVHLDTEHHTVNGETFDAVILASGMAAAAYGAKLTARPGQVETCALETQPLAITRSNYVLSDGHHMTFGATFRDASAGDGVLQTDLESNLASLAALDESLAAAARREGVASRASTRATSPDRMPIVGPAFDWDAEAAFFSHVRDTGVPGVDFCGYPGVSLVTGLGSRGFTLAGLCASMALARLTGEPLPLSRAEADALSPARFLFRDLKRQLA